MAQVRTKKKNHLLPALLAVMVILAGVLFFTREDDGKKEKEVRPHLIASSVEEISWFEITRPDGPDLAFSLNADKTGQKLWQLTKPLEATADQEKVKSLIETATKIVGIPVSNEIEPSTDMSQYNLDEASAISLKVGSDNGKVIDEIQLGKILPLDVGYIYVQKPAEKGRLYKAQKQIKELLEEDSNAYRGHKILYQDPDTITDIVIAKTGTDELHLQKEGSWWNFVSPGNGAADDEKISEMLKGLESATIKDFSDIPLNRISASETGFVTLKLTGPDSVESIVIPYPPVNNPEEAGTSHDPAVVSLDKFRSETLVVTQEELLHRGLLRFVPGDIQDVFIEDNGTTTKIRKTGDNQWKMTAPVEEKAEPALVFRVFSVLVRYRIPDDAYLSSDYSIPEQDAKSTVSFRLVEKSGAEHTIKIYPYNKTSGKVLVTSSFIDRPILLDASVLENVPLGADDFVDKKLLHINPMALGAIEIKRSEGESMRLEKFANEWVVTKPERVAANTPQVWGLIFGMEKAEFLYKLENAPTELPANSVIVAFSDENKAETGVVSFFIPEDGKEYAGLNNPEDIIVSSSALDGYYEASADILNVLPESYRDILYRE